MPIFLAALLGGLVEIVGSLVGKALIALGIGVVAFTGINSSISWAKDLVISKIGAMGSDVVAFAGVLQIGTCVSILTSALVVRMSLQGLTSDTIKRFVNK